MKPRVIWDVRELLESLVDVRISALHPQGSRLLVCLSASPMREASGLGNLELWKRYLSLQVQDSHTFGQDKGKGIRRKKSLLARNKQ